MIIEQTVQKHMQMYKYNSEKSHQIQDTLGYKYSPQTQKKLEK